VIGLVLGIAGVLAATCRRRTVRVNAFDALQHEWDLRHCIFRGATAVALLHAVDDAWLNRQPGVPLGQHALAAVIALAAGIAAVVAFPRLRPGFRAAIALVFGVFAIVNGTLHLIHVTDGGASGSDVTGVLALAAGVVLALLGFAIPFVHRGEGTRTRARRLVNRAVGVLAGALALYAFVFPTSLAIIQAHKYRELPGSHVRSPWLSQACDRRLGHEWATNTSGERETRSRTPTCRSSCYKTQGASDRDAPFAVIVVRRRRPAL
jgi:hypothetical protein